MSSEYLIIKLGGSLVSGKTGVLNSKLVKAYVDEIKKCVVSDNSKDNPNSQRLVLTVGGGGLSRTYRDVALECGEDSSDDQHRIGIVTTWLNAELLRSLLSDFSYKRVLGVGVYAQGSKEGEDNIAKDFQSWLSGKEPVIVGGGFITGASSDYNSVLLASKIGVERFYKLTDVDHVYSVDPKTNPNAKKLIDISWGEYIELIKGENGEISKSADEEEAHKPGQHVPIDLHAAELAEKNNISCVILDGRSASVIGDICGAKKLEGTVIHP